MKKLTLILLLVGLFSSCVYVIAEEPEASMTEEEKSAAEEANQWRDAQKEVGVEFQEEGKAETNALMRLLKTIPEFIWALLAVIIGAILSWFPLWLQLKHDSKEKEKERKMSLRHDVYLSISGKIGGKLQCLVGFYMEGGNTDNGYTEAFEQTKIIGSDETVSALNEFNDYISEAFLELIPKYEEIANIKKRSEFDGKKLAGESDIKKAFQSYKEINERGFKLTYELAGKCQQKTQEAEKLLIPVIVSIRKEIGVPFNESAYLSMMELSNKRWEENTEKYIESMKSTYEEGIKPYLSEFDDLINDNP